MTRPAPTTPNTPPAVPAPEGFAAVDPDLGRALLDVAAPHCEHAGRTAAGPCGWSGELWAALTETGFTGAGLPETMGGSGGSRWDAAELVRLSGYLAAPVPLAETLLVTGPALARAGLSLPDSPVAVATRRDHDSPGLVAQPSEDGLVVTGSIRSVAWARVANQALLPVVGLDGSDLALVRLPDGAVQSGANLADEPRDHLRLDRAPAVPVPGTGARELETSGATARALQIAGALERCLELSLEYAVTRHQFGRPLAQFQAVAHQLALLAEQSAQARMAAEIAVVTGRPEDAWASKVVASEAATTGSGLAHQIHGAIGFTREYHLQVLTRRLWSWRAEFGSETRWAEKLGRSLISEPTRVWSSLAD